jgi:Fe-S oxidoreductase
MAVERATFWYGCNMTRHGEIIRTAARLLETLGVDVATAGGPGHCCGSPKDASARINEGMARRTIAAFNAAVSAEGRETVVTWCPSCHMNMRDSMAPVTPARFETVHITEAVHSRLDVLRPLLVHPVRRRVLVHAHLGFEGRVPVSRLVSEILGCIPGLEVVAHGLRVPGHMCSAIVGVPGALADARRATLAAVAETGADTLGTIHHSCHRECVTLERRGVDVANWTHLLAESLGWAAEDGYKALRNAADPRALVSPARMAAVGEIAFERLIEPELRKGVPETD